MYMPNIYQSRPNQLYRTIETCLNGVTRQITIPVVNDDSNPEVVHEPNSDNTVRLSGGINVTPIKIEPQDDWWQEEEDDLGLQISDVTSLQPFTQVTQNEQIHFQSATADFSQQNYAAGNGQALQRSKPHIPSILQKTHSDVPNAAAAHIAKTTEKVYPSAAVPAKPYAHGTQENADNQRLLLQHKEANKRTVTPPSSTDLQGVLKTTLDALLSSKMVGRNQKVFVGPFDPDAIKGVSKATNNSLNIDGKTMPIQTITSDELKDNQAKVFIYVGHNPDGSVQYKTFDIFATPDNPPATNKLLQPPIDVTQSASKIPSTQSTQSNVGQITNHSDKATGSLSKLANVMLQGMTMPDGTIVVNNIPQGNQAKMMLNGTVNTNAANAPVPPIFFPTPSKPVFAAHSQANNIVQNVSSQVVPSTAPILQGYKMPDGSIVINNIPPSTSYPVTKTNSPPVTNMTVVPASSLVIPKSAGGSITTIHHSNNATTADKPMMQLEQNVAGQLNTPNLHNDTGTRDVSKLIQLKNTGEPVLQQVTSTQYVVTPSCIACTLPSQTYISTKQHAPYVMRNTVHSGRNCTTTPSTISSLTGGHSLQGRTLADGSICISTHPGMGQGISSTIDTSVVSASNIVIPGSMGRSISAIPAQTNASVQLLPNGRMNGQPLVQMNHQNLVRFTASNPPPLSSTSRKPDINPIHTVPFAIQKAPSAQFILQPEPGNTMNVQNVNGTIMNAASNRVSGLTGYIDQQGRLVINPLNQSVTLGTSTQAATIQNVTGSGGPVVMLAQAGHTLRTEINQKPMLEHSMVASNGQTKVVVPGQELTAGCTKSSEIGPTPIVPKTGVAKATTKNTPPNEHQKGILPKCSRRAAAQNTPHRIKKNSVGKKALVIDDSSSDGGSHDEFDLKGQNRHRRQTDVNIGRERNICPKVDPNPTVKVCDIEPDVELVGLAGISMEHQHNEGDDVSLMKVGYVEDDVTITSDHMKETNTTACPDNETGMNDEYTMNSNALADVILRHNVIADVDASLHQLSTDQHNGSSSKTIATNSNALADVILRHNVIADVDASLHQLSTDQHNGSSSKTIAMNSNALADVILRHNVIADVDASLHQLSTDQHNGSSSKTSQICVSKSSSNIKQHEMRPCTVLLGSLNLDRKLSVNLQTWVAPQCCICDNAQFKEKHPNKNTSLSRKYRRDAVLLSEMSDSTESENTSNNSDEDYCAPIKKKKVPTATLR